jgi:hypothetical protein
MLEPMNLSEWSGANLPCRQIATSIAALIIIIALAIDPFTQQIIDYYSQPMVNLRTTSWNT